MLIRKRKGTCPALEQILIAWLKALPEDSAGIPYDHSGDPCQTVNQETFIHPWTRYGNPQLNDRKARG
jgi:hypothetical protein